MKESALQTPILFIIFNRPITTKQVFNQIKKARPAKLFISADGPRAGNIDDSINCLQARKIIDEIDWECEVKMLFRNENLGCGKSVSSAINWFFNHVEEGIILEDDCLPNESFFGFCSLMLTNYRSDNRVMMISGTNFLFNKVASSDDYFFSKTYFVWGWATWKRAWTLYDFEINNWKSQRATNIPRLYEIFPNKSVANYWIENFDKVVNKRVDTWDYQWAYCCIFNNGLSLNSTTNLISNIGFIGTHGSGKSIFLDLKTKNINLAKISSLKKTETDKRLEKITYKNMLIIKPIRYNLIFFLKQNLKKILSFCKMR